MSGPGVPRARDTAYAPMRAGLAPKAMRHWQGSQTRSKRMRGTGWSSTGWAVGIVLSVVLSSVIVGGSIDRTARSSSPVTPPHLQASSRATSDPTWDNGVVQLAFQSLVPSFQIISDHDGRVASTTTLTDLAELTSSGNVTALARFQGPNATWRFAAATGPSGITIWANGTIPVFPGSGPWSSDDGLSEGEDDYGHAHLALTFYMDLVTGPAPNAVRFTVNMTHWPWVNPNDTLGVEMVTTAAGGTSMVPGADPNQVLEVRTGTSTPVSTLSWDAEATVQLNGGVSDTSTVGTTRVIGGGGTNSTIYLQFGAVSGGYSGLSYDPTVSLYPNAFGRVFLPAWVVNQTSILVIALSAILIGLLAMIARESRSRKSDLPDGVGTEEADGAAAASLDRPGPIRALEGLG